MSEEVEFEQYLARDDVATHLEAFVEGLQDGGEITVTMGDSTVEITPPEHLEFEVEIEEEEDEQSVEFELEWKQPDEELTIE